MVTNNEAVDNFLNGKRNLAVYQFSQLIKDQTNHHLNHNNHNFHNQHHVNTNPSDDSIFTNKDASQSQPQQQQQRNETSPTNSSINHNDAIKCQPNSDEIAFNYAMINLFTGCPQRASIIFSDLVKRYPRNPRLWLRLAESMLAAERAKMTEFEHIQQLAYPHSRDHLIKTKNKPILIKINPSYCQQQIQQQFHLQKGTPSNFLITIKDYLQKSLELVNEYNDISLMPEEIPNNPNNLDHIQNNHHLQTNNTASTSPSIGGTTPTTSNLLGQQHNINSMSNPIDNNPPPPSSTSSLLEANPSSHHDTTIPTGTTTTQSKLSQQLSYANPYQSISRSDLYHLRNKIQLNLAYICLCMGEPLKALNYTSQCLNSSPAGYERVLAHLYHAEACILASRFDEAIQLLNLEVLNMAKNLSQDHAIVTGDKSKRVLYGDELQNQLESGSLTTVITYNLGVAYAAKGEFANASKQLERSVQPTKPNPLQIIICLLYIQLQRGHLESAKRTILNNLPQFR